MNWQHCSLLVGNERGVHGRVATRLAEIAAEYGVLLQISRGDETVDCSSILDVLALALVQGTEIRLHAGGDKAEQALRAAQAVVTGQDD
ncbi:MAG: HPr family phosphocarrier protein [Desulfobulbaceae bacterium]|jgi:phosphotransferase system HPr (HPr) family protein|nr:HPr family phosphocarrier protein [Desulfobulbaceae bacterium]